MSKAAALALLDQLETLWRWTFNYDEIAHQQLRTCRQGLHNGSFRPEAVIGEVAPKVQSLLSVTRSRVEIGYLRSLLLDTPAEATGPWIPLDSLERNFLPGIRTIQPSLETVRSHVVVLIFARGVYPRRGDVPCYMAEAVMYEDMCLAVNELVEMGAPAQQDRMHRRKRRMWLARSVVLSAYYFVEAYLNGLAVECLHSPPAHLSSSDRTCLEEYDRSANKERLLKFRDKLLKYPRIIKGEMHPPFQENNDADVAALLGVHRALRDSIVHPSHRYDDENVWFGDSKVGRMINTNAEAAIECAECSIRLVRKIERYVQESDKFISWLRDRDPTTGLFPPESFE